MKHPFFQRSWPAFLGAALLGTTLLSACGGGSTKPQVTPVATPAATPSPTTTATPGPVGASLLVFAMAPEGQDAAQTDIYSANPDGSNLRRLTQSAPDAAGNVQPQGSPALSPDRRQIVWVSVAFQNGESVQTLRIMNADGSQSRLLSADSNAVGATSPTWSFDGTRLAFSRGNDGIWTIGADGSGLRRLTDRGANPSWNRFNRIAFNAAPGVRTTQGSARQTADLQTPRPSAKRQTRGVLPPTTGSYTDIFTVGADGSGLRQLTRQDQTEGGLAAINPAWSPDGKTLVFNSIPGSGISAQLFLIQDDGTNRRLVGQTNGTDAVWSPDGSRIAYSDENGLSLVNSDGSNRVTLNASDALFVEDTDWR